MNQASRIAVACLVGAYYGAYRAVMVSRAKKGPQGPKIPALAPL